MSEPTEHITLIWPNSKQKPRIGLVKDSDYYPYWTKFEKFLRANNLPFRYYDIHCSDWIDKAVELDTIIWRPMSTPSELSEARNKIFFLEHYMHKISYPSFNTLMFYENKILQYQILSLNRFPVIPTFISNSYMESIDYAKKASYPVINKVVDSSASTGVERIINRHHALKTIKESFSFAGYKTYCPYTRQKDSIYFQNYIPNQGYDMRIIVIGNYVFGYYRFIPKGDFRASGMGLVKKSDIPRDAMQLALQIYKCFDAPMLAIDMLRDNNNKLYVIELSAFVQVNTPMQLMVNEVPGTYIYNGNDFKFHPGKFWPQELALKHFLETKYLRSE